MSHNNVNAYNKTPSKVSSNIQLLTQQSQLKQNLSQPQQNRKDQKEQQLSQQQQIESPQSVKSGKFFNLSQVKKLDLKSTWLSNTDQILQKFNQKYQQLLNSKKQVDQNLKIFQEFQTKYRINSLRKVTINFDKKALYQDFLKNNRKTIQKLHPSLIINICSYVDDNIFLAMSKLRRVSKIFNYLYKSNEIRQYLAYKDLGISNDTQDDEIQSQTIKHLVSKQSKQKQKQIELYKAKRKSSISNSINQSSLLSVLSLQLYCKKYVAFLSTVKYYKSIFYTQEIPQNSFMTDLQKAVQFINDIHRIVYTKKNRYIHYFQMINKVMKKNRLVIGLSALSLTSLVLVRKNSIIAFSNYLALNISQRKKQQITKTKYQKVIQVVSNQLYRDSLIVNTKVSNYLQEKHKKDIAIFIAPYDVQNAAYFLKEECKSLDILIFHFYDENKCMFFRNILIKKRKIKQYLDSKTGVQNVVQYEQSDQQQQKLNQDQKLLIKYQIPKKIQLSSQKSQNYQQKNTKNQTHYQLNFLNPDLHSLRLTIMSTSIGQASQNNQNGLQVIQMNNGSQQITLEDQDKWSYCYLFTGGKYYIILFGKK